MIITIDGPAGAGKSSVALALAARLDGEYLDTGAMYRSVALLGIRNNVDWDDPEQLLALARTAVLDSRDGRSFLGDEDVSEAVRTLEVTQKTKYAADHPAIRELMVERQRAIAERLAASGKPVITEGRDQGSVVFPNADRKIFLTATPKERARRRLGELQSRGTTADLGELLEQINARDTRDRNRPVGPLCEPEGAFVLVSDGLNLDQVVERLLDFVRR